MNVQFKRAITTMIVFGILFVFLIVDFALTGVEGFLNRGNFLATSAIIFISIVIYTIMLFQTERSENIVDERDNQIQTSATNVALIITTMFVFLFCVGLFLGYENSGLIPVSWLWLLGYLTFSVAYFSTSTIIVILYLMDR